MDVRAGVVSSLCMKYKLEEKIGYRFGDPRPGDVVVAVNGAPATSIEAVRDKVASAGGSVALLISRNGQRIFVPVRIG